MNFLDAREQWTDSCNVLALKEGVVLGYDRNDKTASAFENAGFEVLHCKGPAGRFRSRPKDHRRNQQLLNPDAVGLRAPGAVFIA